jgi:predicted transcriptional regulator
LAKRKYSQLRPLILKAFAKEQKTVNQVSTETGINWRTVDNHLIYLTGKGHLKTIFISPFVKIYAITEKGLLALKSGGRL